MIEVLTSTNIPLWLMMLYGAIVFMAGFISGRHG